MRYTYLVLTVLFTLFAYWQINDPDPATWIAMYLIVAFVCAYAFFRPLKAVMFWPLVGLLSVGMVTYIPSVIEWMQLGMPSIVEEMQAATPYVEYVREFLGMVISMLALLYVYWGAKAV